MKNEYVCPYCRGSLKVDNDIVFAIRTKNEQRGLIMVSPELGDYRFRKHPDLDLKDGDRLETFCPMCHSNLKAINVNSNLAEVIMVNEEGDEYQIYFSEIVGEHVTFKIKDAEMEKFGDDSEGYINFFGV
ncbi:MAG: hypothetical protein HQ506_12465 [Candidatus Marinimicrobia bacterium]|nr:hypothetical protein [Candidatus Neomarinimicrobiota bacterium]